MTALLTRLKCLECLASTGWKSPENAMLSQTEHSVADGHGEAHGFVMAFRMPMEKRKPCLRGVEIEGAEHLHAVLGTRRTVP